MALQLDPVYDAVFPCDQCAFIAHGPGELEDHLTSHQAILPNAVGAVPVDVVAGPMVNVRPIKSPRTYTCPLCREVVTGYAVFMAHRKQHKE